MSSTEYCGTDAVEPNSKEDSRRRISWFTGDSITDAACLKNYAGGIGETTAQYDGRPLGAQRLSNSLRVRGIPEGAAKTASQSGSLQSRFQIWHRSNLGASPKSTRL